MEVQLHLKTWRIEADPKTKVPKLVGTYGVMCGEKEIAEQKFNDGYSDKVIPFSEKTMAKLKELEADIKTELHALLS